MRRRVLVVCSALGAALLVTLVLAAGTALGVPDVKTIASATHPSVGAWYSSNSPTLEWSGVSRVGAYDTAGDVSSIAISGDVAYIADWNNGLLALDVSDPSDPTPLGSYDTTGAVSDVFVAGDVAYLTDLGNGLQAIDISDPSAPTLLDAIEIDEMWPAAVVVAGDVAYVADVDNGLVTFDVSDPTNLTYLANYDTSWGLNVAVSGDIAYFVDYQDGLITFDVSDPSHITYLDGYNTANLSLCVAVAGDVAYVTDSVAGVYALDVSDPATLALLDVYDTPGSADEIAVVGDVAYVASLRNGFAAVDVSDPTHLATLGIYDTEYARQVVVAGDIAYVADWTWGLVVVDVSDPTEFALLDTYDTAGSAAEVVLAGDVAYVADETGGLAAIDVSDPADLTGVDVFPSSGNTHFGAAVAGDVAYVANHAGLLSIGVSDPTNLTFLDFYDTPGSAKSVVVEGEVAYVADDGGVVAIDVSDPPFLGYLDTYDTAGIASDVAVSGDVAYVADGANGLVALDTSNPGALALVDTCATGGYASSVTIAGDVAYVAQLYSGVAVVDVSDPTDLTLLDVYDTAGTALRVAVEGDVAYVADGESGLVALDASDPANLRLMRTYDTPGDAYGVAIAGDVAYIADGSAGLTSVQIASYPAVHSFVLDHATATVPDTIAEQSEPATTYAGLADGEWYFHVRSQDRFGTGWGATGHRRVLIGGRPTRLAADTRYSTAVNVAREGFDPAGDTSWPGVNDIVLASGEDRAAADPLAASGLCGAYDAPLFLTQSSRVPSEVKMAIKEIANAHNGRVNVHIVGGPASVPDARYAEIAAYVGADKLSKDRLRSTGDRYDMAATIAERMRLARSSGTPPTVVLVANGADAATYFDALALSPIAAARDYPILLVKESSVPSATQAVIDSFGAPRVIIGGGPATVSESVRAELNAERWSGSTRYATATTVATNAIAQKWLGPKFVGVAAKLPDALSGGGVLGMRGGVLLLTQSDTLTPATGSWVDSHAADIDCCYVLGGTTSVRAAVMSALDAKMP